MKWSIATVAVACACASSALAGAQTAHQGVSNDGERFVSPMVLETPLATFDDASARLAGWRVLVSLLRPGGRMLFCEHVLSDDRGRARWQRRLRRPWRFLAAGCTPDRDTLAAIEASPLEVERVDHGKLPKALPIVRPLIRGVAVAPAAGLAQPRVT